MIKATTKKALAARYNVSYPTFLKWLLLIPELKKIKNRRLLTPKEIKIIYDEIGEP